MLYNINYLYLLQLIQKKSDTKAKVLDYGCGKGEVVQLCLGNNFETYGVEAFYEGGNVIKEVKQTGLYNKNIFAIKNEKIPFADKTFDIVVSNQVFEHIDNFHKPLEEIRRVLKDDGIFICIFPSKDVWREGHIGIPLVHWFKKGSKLRFYYVLILRHLGLGNFKGGKNSEQWTNDFLVWLDNYTFYKDVKVIKDVFENYFYVEELKNDWIKYRILHNKHTKKISTFLFLFPNLLSFFQRKLATRVFCLRKRRAVKKEVRLMVGGSQQL